MLRNSLIILSITLMVFEICLRLFFEDVLPLPVHPPEVSVEHKFWKYDKQLGWTHQANASGTFTNGDFSGAVHLGNYGIRNNSAASTYNPAYKNIFFIGDSTTVSFEVDDDETVPALLEQILRSKGLQVNVLNLGVRGYGTDQSVQRALGLAEIFKPVEIIYMYADNDMYNNNVLKQGHRKYGKAVYIRRGGASGSFQPYNVPVPRYQNSFAGLVIFDENCQPSIHEAIIPVFDKPKTVKKQSISLMRKVKDALNENLYSYRALARIKQALTEVEHPKSDYALHKAKWRKQEAEIYERLDRKNLDVMKWIQEEGIDWSDWFTYSYWEGGYYRRHCSAYLESQVQFLLEKLKGIHEMKALHLVEFPSEDRPLEKSRAGEKRINRHFFSKLEKQGVVASYIDLYREMASEGLQRKELQCKTDGHFCEKGNRWIASKLGRLLPLQALELNNGE